MGAPAAGAAPPDWTPPADVPFTTDDFPSIGFAGGVETLSRAEFDTMDPHNVTSRLSVASKAPGGAFVDELVINSTTTRVPSNGTIAVAPNGAAVLVFPEFPSNDVSPAPPVHFAASYRPPGGTWEAPTSFVGDNSTSTVISPEVVAAIGPDGTAVAAVSHLETNDSGEPVAETDARLDAAVHPAGGSWKPSALLSTANESGEDPHAAVDGAGNVTVAWRQRVYEGADNTTRSDDAFAIETARWSASNQTWNSAEQIAAGSAAHSGGQVQLGMNDAGQAVIAYQYTGAPHADTYAASRPDSAHPFGSPVDITPTSNGASPLAAGVAPDGATYVMYNFFASTSANDGVGAVRLPPGSSTWSGHALVSPANVNPLFGGGIAFLGSDAVLAWSEDPNVGGTHAVQATRWPAGASSAESFRNLEAPAQTANIQNVLDDGAGSIYVDWRVNSASPALRSAAFDGGAPFPSGATVPSSVTAGVPATLSASFGDLWSALAGTVSWNFGDGSAAATGPSVSHTFAAPGTYDVTARQSDALGNEATRHFSVVAAPAGSPVPPDTTAPSILTASLTNARFAVDGGGKAETLVTAKKKSKKAKKGTTFKYKLSEAGRVVFRIERRKTGKKKGFSKVGSFAQAGKAGANQKKFSGKLGKKKLSPGSYRVTLTATDAAGNHSRSRQLSFTVVGH